MCVCTTATLVFTHNKLHLNFLSMDNLLFHHLNKTKQLESIGDVCAHMFKQLGEVLFW